MEDDAAVEVSGIVDGARFGPYALTVSVLTTLALVFDGFDIQAIGFAAPRLMSDWGIDRSVLAPILAAGLLGMFVVRSCSGSRATATAGAARCSRASR